MNEQVPPGGPNAGQPQQERLSEIVKTVLDRVDAVVALYTAYRDRDLAAQKVETRFQVHMTWVAFLVVAVIVGSAFWLTHEGKIDGATFPFLLGTVVGYVLTYIKSAVSPPPPE